MAYIRATFAAALMGCFAVAASTASPLPEGAGITTPLQSPLDLVPAPATPLLEAPAPTPPAPVTEPSGKPIISYDLDALPAPVAATRTALLEAAHSADLENFRPILEAMGEPLQVSLTGETDPIAFWRENTGDENGLELMAIMIEILNQGYVRMDAGSANEIYVWPYFFGISLEGLSNKQLVELYMLITPQDADDMKAFGNYIFYRLGITPDGQWRFMLAGD